MPSAGHIFTVGHSTHAIERFLSLLTTHQIATLADVRSYPASRRWPQFNQAELSSSLGRASIEYQWMKHLGGRRNSKREDSPNTAWSHPAFRSYADYAESNEFGDALKELADIGGGRRTAYMCSEGLWWKCHRRIISDYLVIRGWRVDHIMPDGKLREHEVAPFARIVGDRIVYDAAIG